MKGTKGDDVNILDSTFLCSAYSALNHHLLANSQVPPEAPLFMFKMVDGSWAPMKRKWFLQRCNKVWECGELGSRKGHRFKIGSTTHLLFLGVNPWVTMVQGQWSSQAFLGYWSQCEEILPLLMGFHLQEHTSILTTMSSLKSKLLGF